ncbi:hypothetical protein [Spirosoma sp. KUDC1026]|uniref:hypothetical protein n=1 Tax=Spirosoma sp. KUDC1026 TaxID=2745947 RepID=UPI00159BEA43|nr:hypothetical protein [Spirosoma sp. KUDC1026]QKZ14806.1 hypothetical protein HU175_20120 [Spirosoma sp. KUDC1026]
MQTDTTTRHSHTLHPLRFSLNVLYTARLLIGMNADELKSEDCLDAVDERIEEFTDELIATELLHEAAVLAGDVLPVQENSSER